MNLASGTLANRRRDLKIETSKYTDNETRERLTDWVLPFLASVWELSAPCEQDYGSPARGREAERGLSCLVIPAFTAFPAFPATLADAPDV